MAPMLINPGAMGVTNALSKGVRYLPDVSVAPAIALSPRKLVKAFAGSPLQATRVSDAATQDIAFAGSWYDSAALVTFLAGSAARCVLYDQSGNGRNTSQATAANRPLLDQTARAVAFDSGAYNQSGQTQRFLSLPAGLSTDKRNHTTFIVGQFSAPNVGQCLLELGAPNSLANLFTGLPTDGGTKGTLRSTDGTTLYTAASPMVPADFEIYTLQGSSTAKLLGVGEVEVTTAAASAGSVTGGSLGKTGYATTYSKRSGMLAFVQYPGVLSLAERQAVRAALRAIFSTARSGLLVCDGDSLTEGFGADALRGLPHLIASSSGKALRVYNFGVGGARVADVVSRAAQVDSVFQAGGILHVLAGTNNFAYDGTDPTTLHTTLANYCTARRAAGWKVVVGTLLDRGAGAFAPTNQTTFNSSRSTYNGLIQANWASYADAIADYAANANLGSAGASQVSTYFLDGTHLNSVGYPLAGTIGGAAVGSLP